MRTSGQPGHRTTTAHIQAAYPFVAEGGLGGRGVYIGRDVYGGSFCYDPWELYGRELTSPNAVVIGIVGRAKSSLVKTYVFRQAVFGRQAWIVDVKGEYDRLASALGVRPIALSPGGGVRLNPLTPRGGPERQLNLLYSVAAAALERPLVPEEKRAAQEALRVLERRSAGEPTLPAVVDVLIHAPGEMAEALAMPPEELAAATRPMAFALDQLCSGNLHGMFDGPTTPGLDLDAPLVVLNLRAVLNTHTTALGILMTCATAWLQAMIEAETDERSAKRIVVVDEAWRIVSNLGIGEWLQQSFKLSRGLGTQNVVVMHRLSDLRAVGRRGLARGAPRRGAARRRRDEGRLRAASGSASAGARAARPHGHRGRAPASPPARLGALEGRPALVPRPAPAVGARGASSSTPTRAWSSGARRERRPQAAPLPARGRRAASARDGRALRCSARSSPRELRSG